MLKYLATDSTALAGVTKTLVGTITLPEGTKQIVSVAAYAGGPGMTTLESASGIAEFESDDIAINPCQIPLAVNQVVTSGAIVYDPKFYPVGYQGGGKTRIKCSITLDTAQTIAETGRCFICVEV